MAQEKKPKPDQQDSEMELDYGAFQEEEKTPQPVEPHKTEPLTTSPIYQRLQTERNDPNATAEFDAIIGKTPGATEPLVASSPATSEPNVSAPIGGAPIGTAVGPAPRSPLETPEMDAEQRNNLRDQALATVGTLPKIFQVLLAIIFPLVLLVGTLRVVASQLLLLISYQRPGFPADAYGFSTADRLTYGAYPLDYLYNTADSRYLGELELHGQPLFRPEEVSHMTDVKMVIMISMLAGLALAVIGLLMIWYLAKRYPGAIRRAFFWGVIGLLVVAAAVAVVGVLNWNAMFTTFHQIFFPQGNWMFYVDDTLIRLFPEQFWMDAAIGWVGLLVIAIIITLIATWPTKKRRAASAAATKEMYALNTAD